MSKEWFSRRHDKRREAAKPASSSVNCPHIYPKATVFSQKSTMKRWLREQDLRWNRHAIHSRTWGNSFHWPASNFTHGKSFMRQPGSSFRSMQLRDLSEGGRRNINQLVLKRTFLVRRQRWGEQEGRVCLIPPPLRRDDNGERDFQSWYLCSKLDRPLLNHARTRTGCRASSCATLIHPPTGRTRK